MKCPKKEYLSILEKMIEHDSGIVGGTLHKVEQVTIWHEIYNVIYTDWLRLRIMCHRRCRECKIVEDKLYLDSSIR